MPGPRMAAEGTRGSSRCSRRSPRVPPPPYPISSRRRLPTLSPHAERALTTATSCGSLITAHTAQVDKCTRSSSPSAIPLWLPGTGSPRKSGRGVVGRWRRRGPHGALGAPALPGARGGESRARRSIRGPVGRGRASVTVGRGAEQRGERWLRPPRLWLPRWPSRSEKRSAPRSKLRSWNDSVPLRNIPGAGMMWCCAGCGSCSLQSSAGQLQLWSWVFSS